MFKSIRRDSRGMAHMMIIMAVVVIAGVAAVGWYVMKKQDEKKTGSSSSLVTNKEAESACKKLYNDDDLCKFSSSYNGKGPYVGSFTTVDKDGKTSNFTTSLDASGNSSTVVSENGKESSAFISLNGDSYIKDESDGSWTKYPKSTETTKTTAETNPTSDLKVDTTESDKSVDQRIVYKKLGKEACGKDTCFKYQVIDPAAPNTESIVWFGTKDYQLHKWSFKDTDGSTNVGEFTYTTVTITAPSPVKEAPKVPTQAEIDQMIKDATAQSTDEN